MDLGLGTFDPFIDANDDYAVLEWARETWEGKQGQHGRWNQFVLYCPERYYVTGSFEPARVDYQIGDYARAALKVINND
jgi:hypothetical protein